MTYSHVNHDCARGLLVFTTMDLIETMADRINRQLDVKGLNKSKLSRLLGVSRMTVSQWCSGASEPRPENLLALAEVLFDGDAHYLVFGPRREPDGGFPAPPRRSGSSETVASFRRRRNV